VVGPDVAGEGALMPDALGPPNNAAILIAAAVVLFGVVVFRVLTDIMRDWRHIARERRRP
jgi:hypothetical protein